jgi:hypothetical protein
MWHLPGRFDMPLKSRLCWALLVGSLSACASAENNMGPTPSNPGPAPTVSTLSPSSGQVGTTVVIRGSHFAATGNHVKFSLGYIKNLESADGTTLRFVVPDALDPCPPDSTDPCPTILAHVVAGDYPVAVITGGAASNSVTFTVTQ